MCPHCNHFQCDRDARHRCDGFTFIVCHKCAMAALAVDWAKHIIDYRIQLENKLLSGEPAGRA